MCRTCQIIDEEIQALTLRKKEACTRKRRILTGMHKKKLKQPERQDYYRAYYLKHGERKRQQANERNRKLREEQNAQTT